MKMKLFVLLPVLCCFFCTGPTPVYRDAGRPLEDRVDHLLSLLTPAEKANFLSGKDFWHLEGVERLGIPAIQVTDCGHGVTVILDEAGNYTGCATCFPTAVAQASSWDRDLVFQIGRALALETRALGSTVLLAPMVNIHRTPLNGRNYETFSEDPYLTGKMASAFIKGVQSLHIGACIKALTANNQQKYQQTVSANVPERALHEIYFPGFRIPIFEAGPWAVMTCYNRVNGEYTSACKYLLTDLVKKRWKYDGLIVSDWRGTHSSRVITAGLDLEMPGPGKFMRRQDILDAVENGDLSRQELDDRVRRILRALVKSKLLDKNPPKLESAWNSPAIRKLARKAAEESIILLKNNGNVLPFEMGKIKKLAVIGPNARQARLGGGGSASVTPCYAVSPFEGLQNCCGDSVELLFEEGCSMKGGLPVVYPQYLQTDFKGETLAGLKAEYFNGGTPRGEAVCTRVDEKIDFSWGWATPCQGIDKMSYSARWSGEIIPAVTGMYQIGLSCTGAGCRLYLDDIPVLDLWNAANDDNFEATFTRTGKYVPVELKAGVPRNIRIEFYKKNNKNSIRLEWEIPGQKDPIADAARLAAGCDAAVVFAGLSNFFEGGNNDRSGLELPGEQNRLVEKVAEANPNTAVVLINGSPLSMPWLEKVNAVIEAYYPGQEGGHAIAGVLFGRVNPSGKLPETFPKRLQDNPTYGHYPGNENDVDYAEGIYVGYRFYDSKNVRPLFPFGFGLSYTAFAYDNMRVEPLTNGRFSVSVDVKNTGRRAGAEVVQLYIKDRKSSVDRPEKELKGFEKVFLKPGETKTVKLLISKQDFAFYSEKTHGWILEPGLFDLYLAGSSRDIRQVRTVRIDQEWNSLFKF